MKEWVTITSPKARWGDLAREAHAFVASILPPETFIRDHAAQKVIQTPLRN